MYTISVERKSYSVKIQTLAIVVAIVSAVLLPQFFHWVGIISGAGKNPGVAFSPMHLPVMLIGLLIGPYAGAITGFMSPIAAHFLSGMPTSIQLPFMCAELLGYGLSAGLLRNIRIPAVAKVLLVQIFGRICRMVLCIFAFYVLGNEKFTVFSIWQSVPRCLPGIILQLTFIPLIVYWINIKIDKALQL